MTKARVPRRNRIDAAVRAIPWRAGPECRTGVGREVPEDEIDHELHADQRGQGKRVQQEGDEAEDAGAATKGEIEACDKGQRQDLCHWGDQLGEGRGWDDLCALGGVDPRVEPRAMITELVVTRRAT